MKCLMSIAIIAISFHFSIAQGNSLALRGDTNDFIDSPQAKVQTYYENLLAQHGGQYRYKAASAALEVYGEAREEYCAKLYNLLAEEAALMYELDEAISYYKKVVETDFKDGFYTQGIMAEQEKMKALMGLRNIAMEDKNYEEALVYHLQYQEMLQNGWSSVLEANRLKDAKIAATCHQHLGQSEKAIELLAPYAFGNYTAGYSEIDKETIDHLTDLLQSKYPKKHFRKVKLDIVNQVKSEQRDGKLYFYIHILENKIYFPNDGADYANRAAKNETLTGEAIAHYQRKLMNSYFYQSLMR